jgi:hypothetical protein
MYQRLILYSEPKKDLIIEVYVVINTSNQVYKFV